MEQEDGRRAAGALEVVSSAMERGARSVRPDNTRRFVLVTCLTAVGVGASFDIPASLQGAGAIIRFPIPMVLVFLWTVYVRRTWRARPIRRGWTQWFLAGAIAVHLVLYLAALLVGLALQRAAVPLPFTLASLCYVAGIVGLALLLAPRLSAGYARHVSGGQW